ncbi:hypothetical protein DFH11DRAFT_116668 [Phellopilus nigrolimitatus]|nr:hypothetical protein DFH11DRAFT_116668 [Phellopilus nigrolimitatus]
MVAMMSVSGDRGCDGEFDALRTRHRCHREFQQKMISRRSSVYYTYPSAASFSPSSVCSPVFLRIRHSLVLPRPPSPLSVRYYLDYRWRAFYTTYAAYLRITHAGEHLLLSYGYQPLAPLDSFQCLRLGGEARSMASVSAVACRLLSRPHRSVWSGMAFSR